LKRFTCERCRVPFIVTFSDSILQEKRFSEPRKKRSNVLNTATSFYPGAGNIASKNNSEEKRLMDDKRKLKVIQELFRYVCVFLSYRQREQKRLELIIHFVQSVVVW
jgi:hypothetical protein